MFDGNLTCYHEVLVALSNFERRVEGLNLTIKKATNHITELDGVPMYDVNA